MRLSETLKVFLVSDPECDNAILGSLNHLCRRCIYQMIFVTGVLRTSTTWISPPGWAVCGLVTYV